MNRYSNLRIVVALKAEAKPIIEHFSLAPLRERPFKTYASPCGEVALVVSGMGRSACAAATVFLSETTPNHGSPSFINIGIAGGRGREIGSVWRAQKVTCQGSHKVWYPGVVGVRTLPCASLVTVDQPELSYPGDSLFDMECAGFFEMACRLTTFERIHALKVISDNEIESVEKISKERIGGWIQGAMACVDALAVAMSQLNIDSRDDTPVATWQASVAQGRHFSVTQGHQLRRLLERFWALSGDAALLERCLDGEPNGREYLQKLSNLVSELPVAWGER